MGFNVEDGFLLFASYTFVSSHNNSVALGVLAIVARAFGNRFSWCNLSLSYTTIGGGT